MTIKNLKIINLDQSTKVVNTKKKTLGILVLFATVQVLKAVDEEGQDYFTNSDRSSPALSRNGSSSSLSTIPPTFSSISQLRSHCENILDSFAGERYITHKMI